MTCTSSWQVKNKAAISKELSKYRYTSRAKDAILYRMCQESQLNPKAVSKIGGGVGLLQWSRWPNNNRVAKLNAYARSVGKSAWSITAQVGFMDQEMKVYKTQFPI